MLAKVQKTLYWAIVNKSAISSITTLKTIPSHLYDNHIQLVVQKYAYILDKDNNTII